MESQRSIDSGLFERQEPLFVRVQPTPERRPWRTWLIPTLLFAATVYTTIRAGGVAFSVTLLAILLSHEFGHYFTARAHGVSASLPHFIPFPSLAGTMGAVIRMRGTMPNRKALVDIGASGPIAGFLVAVPMLFVGLKLSTVGPSMVPDHLLPPQTPLRWLVDWLQGNHDDAIPLSIIQEGPSLIYVLAKWAVFGRIPVGADVNLHPVAFAAWFGLFVTALNLIPVGQLDGGHVLYAVIGGKARIVGRIMLWVLLVLGLTMWMGWLLWAFLGWKVVKTIHPPVDTPEEPLDRRRTIIAWFSLAMFVLTFIPVPLAIF